MASPPFYCTVCGTVNQSEAAFCFACGQALHSATPLPQPLAGSFNIGAVSQVLAHNHLLRQRYRVIERVGKGGFSAVYKAEDIVFNNRLVAVKEMRQSSLTREGIVIATRAFRREALLLAALTHPSLPHIYDHFPEAGRWYLVMDFIEGETLDEHLRNAPSGRLPIEEVLSIGIQLCTVLDYLHQCQPSIIFRDLKPTNVMLTSAGHIYLIDFGIARHFKPGQQSDTGAFGTEGYAAPEQYGEAQTTPRSDIYSLGATLHQMLSGHNPVRTPFLFGPLQLRSHPILAGLETLITQMLNIYENRRPANMAIVKQKLQLIASQWVTEKTSVPEPQAPRRSRQRPPTTLRQFLIPPQMTSVGTLLCTYRGHQSLVRAVTWSPDGKCIASVSHDEVVQVWQIAHGDKNTFAKDVLSYCGHACWVYAVAWSPDGQFIASACADKVVQVWKVATGDKICSYRGHVARVNALAWSLDGECIASASDDRTVQVWNATTGKISSICQGHNGAVHALVWSPDGQRIASATRQYFKLKHLFPLTDIGSSIAWSWPT